MAVPAVVAGARATTEPVGGALRAVGPPPPACEPAESHICGAGATKTAVPERSAAVRAPVRSADTESPEVAVGNVSLARAGFAAAAALVTSTSSWTPVGVAATIRFTPGKTFAYVAVEPDSAGTGSDPNGDDTDKLSFACDKVNKGPEPPSDNVRPVVICAGATRPSGCTDNAVFTGAHDPSGC
jgi:hypothetical protein